MDGHIEGLVGEVDAVFDDMVDVRRTLHQHPELGFEETGSTLIVRERLQGLGLAERAVVTPTGAAYTLTGGHPGRPVVLRADIDALPITEEVGLPFASGVAGKMHACGHDAHTAVLLGVAQVLQGRAEDLSGSYTFVFQPAEELLGGARQMVDGGVLDGLEGGVLLGHHVTSVLPTGLVGMRPGIAMAEVHMFSIVVRGPGGHGAVPNQLGDVVRAICDAVSRLGAVVEGLDYEHISCVCSAGMVRAGTAPNVLPDHASLRGTLRTFTPEQRTEALDRLRSPCDRVGSDHGVSVQLGLPGNAPAVFNDPSTTDTVTQVARAQLGAERVMDMPPVTPSDDVSVFLQRLPGCYFFVGGALSDGTSGMHHSPTFAIDEEAMRVAARLMVGAAVALADSTSGDL
jgi:amidohydrolase